MISLEYFAGFVDGEGSLSINRIPRPRRSPEYCTRLSVVNTSRWILEEIKSELGGTLADIGQRNEKWKVGYALIWSNAAAERLVGILVPSLRVKSRQAQALLAFANHKDSFSRPRDREGRLLSFPEDERRIREEFYWAMRAINAKGVGKGIPEFAYKAAERFSATTMGSVSPDYLAGFIDGEGSLMITKSPVKKDGTVSYWARVAITNTNRKVIEDIHRDFGGLRADQPSRDPNWKAGHAVIWTDPKVEALLAAVGPHLRVKVKQAQLLLEFIRQKRAVASIQDAGKPTIYPRQGLELWQAYYETMRELNAKGPREASRALRGGFTPVRNPSSAPWTSIQSPP